MYRPSIIATLGFPGSGKTYFSTRLSKQYNFIHINSDKFRVEIFQNPIFSISEHETLFRFLEYFIEELVKNGMSVIIDANSPKIEHRIKFRKIAKRNNANYLLVHIATPIDLAVKRVITRKEIRSKEKRKYHRSIDVATIFKIESQIEYPQYEEPFLEIDGTKNFKEQLFQFEGKIKALNMYLPERKVNCRFSK